MPNTTQNALEGSANQVDRWTILKSLGSGSSSKVYLGYDNSTDSYAALKVHVNPTRKMIEFLRREAITHSNLYHDHILGIHGFQECTNLMTSNGTALKVSVLTIEYAGGGSMLLLVQKLNYLPEIITRTYFRQLLSAIEYIHRKGWIHRDIKPENLMLDGNYSLKLADFGCMMKNTSGEKIIEIFGTSNYFAPEIHHKEKYYGAQADLFAAAMVLFIMVVGHNPFLKATEKDQHYRMIMYKDFRRFWKTHEKLAMKRDKNHHFKKISNELKELIQTMLAYNPMERPSISEIKKTDWYNGPVLNEAQLTAAIKELITLKETAPLGV